MTDGTKIAAAILAAEAARQMHADGPKAQMMATDPTNNLMGYFHRYAIMIEKADSTPKD